jgi:hypothetical protein
MTQPNTTRYEPLVSLASDGELESWLACASEPDGRRYLVVIERIPRAASDDNAPPSSGDRPGGQIATNV